MSRINRDFFKEHLQDTLFPHGLKPSQIEGHDAILDTWERSHAKEDDRWLAYMLATAFHETARTLQPVRETLAVSDEQAAKRLETAWQAGKLPWVKTPYWRRDGDGKYWFGRGLVQLTHKENYAELGKRIGVDLTTDPNVALTMAPALQVMFYGMINGSFTKRRLADFFDKGKADWVHARQIVNGLDRAADIAGYARAYYAAISYTM